MAKKDEQNKEHQLPAQTTGGAVTTFDYGSDSGVGFEGIKATDLSIPFLALLQSNSPQVENNNPENAKSGMLFNTVTHELYDGKKGVVIMPCYREDKYVEWPAERIPGDKTGPIDRHEPTSDVVKKAIAESDKKFGKLKAPNGNVLVQTSYIYCLILNEEGAVPEGFAVISCASTKQKPFKGWFTSLYMVKGKPPLFAHRTIVRSVDDQNKKGKFKNFEFVPLKGNVKASMVDPVKEKELLTAGKDFRDMVTSGAAKAAFNTEHAEEDTEAGDTGVDPKGDGNAPF